MEMHLNSWNKTGVLNSKVVKESLEQDIFKRIAIFEPAFKVHKHVLHIYKKILLTQCICKTYGFIYE
jgi:hypothetical protein